MRIPSAAELLKIWEHGLPLYPVQRGLLLLAALFPEQNAAELGRWPFGRRDAQLLTLREQLFGTSLASLATCPHCGEALELNFEVDELRLSTAQLPDAVDTIAVESAGHRWQLRLPGSTDLLSIDLSAGQIVVQQALLRRCLYIDNQAEETEALSELDELSHGDQAMLIERLAQADPQADVQLALTCPACAHRWEAQFDILAYLWQEIGNWAQRTLREIHILAGAYGWSETAILALSAQRRQFYLDLVAGG